MLISFRYTYNHLICSTKALEFLCFGCWFFFFGMMKSQKQRKRKQHDHKINPLIRLRGMGWGKDPLSLCKGPSQLWKVILVILQLWVAPLYISHLYGVLWIQGFFGSRIAEKVRPFGGPKMKVVSSPKIPAFSFGAKNLGFQGSWILLNAAIDPTHVQVVFSKFDDQS